MTYTRMARFWSASGETKYLQPLIFTPKKNINRILTFWLAIGNMQFVFGPSH